MRYRLLGACLCAWMWTLVPANVVAHCQVPCGIYDDHARIHGLLEDVTTIEKAVGQITSLAGASDATSLNQRARWIATKEAHASHVIEVVSTYFLTQKTKPAGKGDAEARALYLDRLEACHRVMVAAMKTKQTVDPGRVAALRAAVVALGERFDSR